MHVSLRRYVGVVAISRRLIEWPELLALAAVASEFVVEIGSL